MSDDLARNYNIANDTEQQQSVLCELQLLLIPSPNGNNLSSFGLPMPSANFMERLRNTLLMEEKNYDREQLSREHKASKALLNTEQKAIYEDVLTAITSGKQILAFVYGHGNVVLAVAASGIASLLLPSGRTAHSRFKIPFDLADDSLCDIKKNTHLSQLITEAVQIIWDEAPMSDRRCFESLNKSLQDILDKPYLPFGGKSMLLGGDFRQTLPIVHKASISSIIASSLPNSYQWRHFKIYQLTQNMRLQRPGMNQSEASSIARFSSWLISLGNRKLGIAHKDDPQNTKKIQIPSEQIIQYSDTAFSGLIHFIYDVETLQNPSATTLSKKAIVCPKNETTQHINNYILSMCPGTSKTYSSINSIVPHAGDNGDTEMFTQMSMMRISEIKEFETPSPIEVRILKKWTRTANKPELCYLLIDEHGYSIEQQPQ
ncbi:uncharacterized protein LOC143565431 [Bidens hawaiensis]|uniref:uncharacterized protein LOC143565431 n=1 Tax=Bidens hawaiensis TaxID=980011 RepID=UPI00404987E5